MNDPEEYTIRVKGLRKIRRDAKRAIRALRRLIKLQRKALRYAH